MSTKVRKEPGRVAKFLDRTISVSHKRQSDIAKEIGYPSPNVITMFKQGLTKLPIDKVPAMAAALEVDTAHLMNLALSEYMPNVAEVLSEVYGDPASKNERVLLNAIREATNLEDPVFDKATIDAVVKVVRKK